MKALKWAVVTGASAGLGSEFARLAAQDGHSVILIARRKDRLDELASEIKSRYGVHAEVLAADLSKGDSCKSVYKQVLGITTDVDVLINNAGFGTVGAFAAPDLSKQLEMLDLNIRALVELTGLFLPRMKNRCSGKILNVGSLAGFQPGPFMSVYYATKAFVNSFSEALHEELKGSGVTCTVLAPGPVHTEFGKVAGVDQSRLFRTVTGPNAAEVADIGYRAMIDGEAIVIPGFSNKMLPTALRLAPRSFIRKASGWLNKSAQ